MKKVLIFLLLFVVACGPSEEEIQTQIDQAVDEAVSKATSTSSTIATTTTALPITTTSTTTTPISVIEVFPNIEIDCKPVKNQDGYLFFNIKITRGTVDIEVVNIVSWFDSTRTDNLFISEDMPESEGLSRELSYKVDDKFTQYEIEVLVMDTNDNFATDYCLYDTKTSETTTTSTMPTTTTTILYNSYTSEELDFYKSAFSEYGDDNIYVRWRKPEVTVSVEGNYLSWIQSIFDEVNSAQDAVNFTVYENQQDADIRLYFGPLSTWGNHINECAQQDNGKGTSRNSWYYEQKIFSSDDIVHDDVDNNSIIKRRACFGDPSEHYERYKSLAETRRYQYTGSFWRTKMIEQLYITILESVTGAPPYLPNPRWCVYLDETTKGSAGELYPLEKEPYKHVSCGQSSYLSDQEGYRGFSKLDLKFITIHYDQRLENVKTTNEAYNLLSNS